MAMSALTFSIRFEEENKDKLHVPDRLEGMLADGFLNVELLVDGSDDSWFVTLLHEEFDNGWKMYLDFGWSDFVNDFSLNIGDILMFGYRGNNVFNVRIFYYTGSPQGIGAGHLNHDRDFGKKRGRKAVLEGDSGKMAEKNAMLDQVADACGETCFKAPFTKKYFDQAVINVPLPFARQHFVGFPPTTDVILQYFDSQFPVQLKIVAKKNTIIQCALKNGVRKFIDYCDIQVNDAGLFKYREGYPIIFDVDLV